MPCFTLVNQLFSHVSWMCACRQNAALGSWVLDAATGVHQGTQTVDKGVVAAWSPGSRSVWAEVLTFVFELPRRIQ